MVINLVGAWIYPSASWRLWIKGWSRSDTFPINIIAILQAHQLLVNHSNFIRPISFSREIEATDRWFCMMKDYGVFFLETPWNEDAVTNQTRDSWFMSTCCFFCILDEKKVKLFWLSRGWSNISSYVTFTSFIYLHLKSTLPPFEIMNSFSTKTDTNIE